MIKRRRWAWRMLPFDFRFDLVLMHVLARHDSRRLEWAKYLRELRKQ